MEKLKAGSLRFKRKSVTKKTLQAYDNLQQSIPDLEELLIKNPTQLNLSAKLLGEAVTTELATFLKHDKKVEKLFLSNNQIGDKGVPAIAELITANDHITELNLSYNQITVEGVKVLSEALKNNKNLAKLNLSWNELKDEGVAELAKAVEVNTGMTMLVLSRNGIGNEGVAVLSKSFEENTTLVHVFLNWNDFDEDGAQTLCGVLEKNVFISLNFADETDPHFNESTKEMIAVAQRKQKFQKTRIDALSTVFVLIEAYSEGILDIDSRVYTCYKNFVNLVASLPIEIGIEVLEKLFGKIHAWRSLQVEIARKRPIILEQIN